MQQYPERAGGYRKPLATVGGEFVDEQPASSPEEIQRRGGKKVCRIDKDGTRTIYPSIAAAARSTKINAPSISQVCRGIQKTAGDCWWEFVDEQPASSPEEIQRRGGKKVCRIDKDGTRTIYPSITAAARAMRITHAAISQACREIQKTAGDCWWEFVDEQPASSPEEIQRRGGKKVCRIDKDDTRTIYPSITAAARSTKIGVTSISRACSGALKTAGGYRWEYVNERE